MTFTKQCTRCGEVKDTTEFSLRRNGDKTYVGPTCRPCDCIRMQEYRKDGTYKERRCPEKQREHNVRSAAKNKQKRRDGEDRARFIIEDARNGDRKFGRDCDLDRDFVESEITKGCSYCGSLARMTMDRIDNDLGHLKTNVAPACYRCNMIRRDMPHGAWMAIVPAIKAASDSGLFGDWYSVPVARKTKTRKDKIIAPAPTAAF